MTTPITSPVAPSSRRLSELRALLHSLMRCALPPGLTFVGGVGDPVPPDVEFKHESAKSARGRV